MVACTSSGTLPLEALSGKPFGSEASFQFRLSADRVSVASSEQQSVYKQRIDAMFDDSRSSLYGHSPSRPSNFVQVKIEKMFQEVSSSSEDELHRQLKRPEANLPSQPNGTEKESFAVNYLGKVPLTENNTTLQNLQQPLRQLYFRYKADSEPSTGSSSRMEISTQGLKLTQPGSAKPELHSFSTIAVWAAVKCVARAEGSRAAFLPLIADPDGHDKSALFAELTDERDMQVANGAHSPLLAVIMRQRGTAARQLFCHAYECSCAEDAIVIAANLYQALMVNLKSKPQQPVQRKSSNASRLAASSKQPSESGVNSKAPVPPKRRPKQQQHDKLLTSASDNCTTTDDDARVRRRSQPDGDILTKITIPKSRSFLVRNGGSSLHELFAEIRTQEGVSNMDEVLEKIVNANGMSYNDLKPLYKELLLKLAVTLTKDELYLRSKSIMKRQVKQSRKRGRRKRGIRHAFRKSVKKIKGSCQKAAKDEDLSNLISRRRPRSGSTSSSCRSGHGGRSRRNPDAVETRLSNIANKEMRRQAQNLIRKGEMSVRVRESSSGYVSCSDCSLTSCLCDTDSCLDSDKCYCSLQNNKKQFVTSSSWRHHLNKPPSNRTSQSLQMLLQQPITTRSRRPSSYCSRMNVYDVLPSQTASIASRTRYHSVDNLALDYELFRYNAARHAARRASLQQQQMHQRVMVVSARDDRGRLIYGGDSQRSRPRRSSSLASEALAVKKTTEIASLFSNMKLSQTTDIRGFQMSAEDEVFYHTLEPEEHAPLGRRGSYPGSTLENSLGYLP
ncbi:uncharacterized protein LOC132203495 [Neocloeon triangulifer]|uniref:uncharacterized protein LOC132203495 n=1 Tax=Neocloeon triangulifer TaxID=2078957 RepID=UPI00286F2DCB|nr:uncharacterized protein LOC132203495 [Neocloeon triangulifer]